MDDNILGFPGYHITKEGKLYNKGHLVKTFFHKGMNVLSYIIRRLERLKLKGNTNKYIAKRLKVSGATVGNYLSGKYYKN